MFGRNNSGHSADDAGQKVPSRRRVDAVRFSPPDGVSAAEAGVLLDGRIGAREVAVMLVDLSRRGWYSMGQENGRWAFVTPRQLPPADATLLEAERLLLSAMFRASPAETPGSDVPVQYVSMTSLTHRLQGHVGKITTALGDHLVAQGLMSRNPVTRGLTRRSSLLTTQGEAVREQCAGYRMYLATAEAGALLNDDVEGFVGDALPYAIAFDIVPRWAERIGSAPVVGAGAAASMLRDLQTNPVLVGVAAASPSGFDLVDLMTLAVARNYGARFPGDAPGRR